MRRWACSLIVGLALAAPSAQAHHSLAGYDHARQVAFEGVVSEFHFTNPHPFLVVSADAGAGAQLWRLEMDNLFELDEIGISRDTFRPRDRVLVKGSPGRDGSRSLYLWRLDRPADGLRYEQVGSSPRLSFHPK